MIDSGLEEMWKQIYAKNAVVHMVNGLTYARTLRAHSLSLMTLGQCLEYQSLTNSDVQILPEICSQIINSCTVDEYLHYKVEPILQVVETTMTALEKINFGYNIFDNSL